MTGGWWGVSPPGGVPNLSSTPWPLPLSAAERGRGLGGWGEVPPAPPPEPDSYVLCKLSTRNGIERFKNHRLILHDQVTGHPMIRANFFEFRFFFVTNF